MGTKTATGSKTCPVPGGQAVALALVQNRVAPEPRDKATMVVVMVSVVAVVRERMARIVLVPMLAMVARDCPMTRPVRRLFMDRAARLTAAMYRPLAFRVRMLVSALVLALRIPGAAVVGFQTPAALT